MNLVDDPSTMPERWTMIHTWHRSVALGGESDTIGPRPMISVLTARYWQRGAAQVRRQSLLVAELTDLSVRSGRYGIL